MAGIPTTSKYDLVSFGVVILALAIAIGLMAAKILPHWSFIFPIFLIIVGFWFVILGALYVGKPVPHQTFGVGRPIYTSSLGFFLVFIGALWITMSVAPQYTILLLAVFIGFFGVLIILATLWRRK